MFKNMPALQEAADARVRFDVSMAACAPIRAILIDFQLNIFTGVRVALQAVRDA